ncbi:hypothetical protein QN277_029445 [Acacia crassicarpa]|uniref:Major facilitator superfamily (MFS) profile domain-containing protein n=1 Tax=Acacia crassicarpa TaxID=499986 RepID=A0AAE1J5B4_9FABA|nr:hypothetical protein QN277_029445 [Acacia crassicarpa]
MGAGVVVAGTSNAYPGKLTWSVFKACIVASMGGLIFGYDIGISGGVTSMDSFLVRFFPSVYRQKNLDTSTNEYCQYDSEVLTLFTSSLYLAALLSSLVASTMTRKFGRKNSMLIGGVLFFAGALFNAFAQAIWMLIVGRMLLGFGIGFCNQSVPLYLSEMAPYKYRGSLNVMFQMSITIGILIANVLNYLFAPLGDLGWRLSLGGAMVPALIIVVGSFFLPDTPNSMIERGDHEAARASLKKIRGVEEVDEEFRDMIMASDACIQESTKPMEESLTKKVSTPTHHVHHDPLLPAAHRHQRHHVLCTSSL